MLPPREDPARSRPLREPGSGGLARRQTCPSPTRHRSTSRTVRSKCSLSKPPVCGSLPMGDDSVLLHFSTLLVLIDEGGFDAGLCSNHGPQR